MPENEKRRLIEAIADGHPLPGGDADVTPALSALNRIASAFRVEHEAVDPTGEPLFRWRHLDVVSEIGEGGFGKVYRAYDSVLKRDVALKLSRQEKRAGQSTLVAEARRMARLRHPNILVIHGADEVDGRAGIWCDLLAGETLQQVADREGRLDSDGTLRMALPLTDALCAIHAAGLTHGDVKPSNVMIQPDGQPVLMDFGAGGESGASKPLAGSPLVMAPELFDGSPLTPACDVYSMGVLLYRLLTGRYPVEADSMDSMISAHENPKFDFKRVPRRMRSVVSQCLVRKPEDRPTMKQLAVGLSKIAAGPRRRRLLATGIVSLILAAAVGVFITSRLSGPAEPTEDIVKPANSVAVLPLGNISEDRDSRYFSDGLSEEILHQLSNYRQMHVVARATSFAFRDADLSAAELADRLRVRYLLQGSVRHEGNALRVTARLVDEASKTVWSETYDRTMTDVFALQTEIAAAVARQMSATISGSLVHPNRYEPNVEAYQEFLLGREYLRARTPGFHTQALAHFSAAVEADPGYAAPLAGRALVFLLAPKRAALAVDHYREAERAVDAALHLNPDDAFALAAQGLLLETRNDHEGAETALRRAVDTDPNIAGVPTWLSNALVGQGKFAESREVLAAALRRDPLDPRLATNLAARYSNAGDFDAAQNLLLRLLDLPNPPQPAYSSLFHLYDRYGRFDRLIEAGKRWILAHATADDEPHFYYSFVAYGYARLGMFEQAEYWQTRAESVTPVDPFTRLRRSYIYMLKGDVEAMERPILMILKEQGFSLDRLPPFVAQVAGAIRIANGDYLEGIQYLESTFSWDAPMPQVPLIIDLMQRLAHGYQQIGETDRAVEILQYIDDGLNKGRKLGIGDNPEILGVEAVNHAMLGDHEAAIMTFQAAFEAGYRLYQYLLHDDRVAALNADPRFVRLLAELRTEVERQRIRVTAADASDQFVRRLEEKLQLH